MGYRTYIESSLITIRESDKTAFFKLAEHLMSNEMMSKYGTFSGLFVPYYPSVDTERARAAVRDKEFEDFFWEWGWIISTDSSECDEVQHYWLEQRNDGSARGDEERFFSAIAPCVQNDSYVQARNENGECWRWIWHNGILYTEVLLAKLYGNRRKVDIA